MIPLNIDSDSCYRTGPAEVEGRNFEIGGKFW